MDAHKNFAYSTVATAPSPAASGTSLIVAAGDGAKFPAVPFNAVIWQANAFPLSTNAEVVRVTAIATDTLTITRSQESSSARTVLVGDQIAASITAKTLTDIEFPDGVVYQNRAIVSGSGVFINHGTGGTPGTFTVALGTGNALSLINLDLHNTDASGVSGNSALDGIYITTETDSIDCGTAIKLVNKGRADTIYVGLQGKAGAVASSPTGIGMDLNRTSVSGNGENSALNTGLAVQIWDWSETNQGIGGPRIYYARKVNNFDSDHCGAFFDGYNRRAIEIVMPGTVAAGGSGAIPTVGGTFSATQPVIEILLTNTSEGITAGARFQVLAAGHVVLANGAQLLFNPITGNQSTIYHDSSDILNIRLGAVALSFLRNSDGVPIASLFNNSDLLLTGNLTVNGLLVSKAKPTASQTIPSNGCAYIFGQPYVIPAGIVITISAGAILRVGP